MQERFLGRVPRLPKEYRMLVEMLQEPIIPMSDACLPPMLTFMEIIEGAEGGGLGALVKAKVEP